MSKNLQIFGNRYDNVNKIKVNNITGQQITYTKEPILIEKYITSNGIYNASDDGADGFLVADINVSNQDEGYGEKTITKDGIYYALNDNLLGYYKVIVDNENEVAGKDPEGSDDDVIATVDEESGKIVIKKIPASIKITTLPTKLEYNDKDIIDYTGMIVKVYDKDDKIFSNKKYKNGVIPDGELDKPVKTATYGGGSGMPVYVTPADDRSAEYKKHGMIFEFTEIPGGFTVRGFGGARLYTFTSAGRIFAAKYRESGNYYDRVVIASSDILRMHHVDEQGRESEYVYNVTSYAIGYSDFYFAIRGVQCTPGLNDAIPYAAGDAYISGGFNENDVAHDIVYFGEGESPMSRQDIPVNWVSPYDGKTLTDSFTITVNPPMDPEPEDDDPEDHPE